MLVALEDGHPREIDRKQGALCSIGKEVHIPTPINDIVYSSLKPHILGSKVGSQRALDASLQSSVKGTKQYV
jgi:hypothetical protein